MKTTCFTLLIVLTCLFTSCKNAEQESLMGNAVQMEKNLYIICTSEYDNAQGVKGFLRSGLASHEKNEYEDAINIYLLDYTDQIDKETKQVLIEIDKLKLDLLRRNGENLYFKEGAYNENRIVQSLNTDSLRPIEFNASAIRSKDKLVENLPSGNLYTRMNTYCINTTKIIEKYSIHSEDLNSLETSSSLKFVFQDQQLLNKIQTFLNNSKYATETKLMNLPLITVFNNLSILQKNILTVRRLAFQRIANVFEID